jgi:hypothetical protein
VERRRSLKVGAGGGGRTRTRFEPNGILSPHPSCVISRHGSANAHRRLSFSVTMGHHDGTSGPIQERVLPAFQPQLSHRHVLGENLARVGIHDDHPVGAVARARVCPPREVVARTDPLTPLDARSRRLRLQRDACSRCSCARSIPGVGTSFLLTVALDGGPLLESALAPTARVQVWEAP